MSSNSTDHDWFMEQVRREQNGLRVFVRSLGMRAEAVDDVAQECFIVAFQKLQTFERGTNFGAWVRAIARILVRNELRREGRRQRLLAEYVAEILVNDEVPMPEESPARIEALRRCLSELPEKWRRLVQQRYFENLSPSVIGSQESRTANEVSQTLFRLRAALYKCITRRLSEQAS